jgi:hypothetical protein
LITRELLIATLSAVAALAGCTQPLSRPPVTAPTSEAPAPTTAVPPAPPPTTASPVEPRENQTPTAAPPAPPSERTAVAPPNAPAAGRSPPKAAPSAPEAAPTLAKPPVAATAPTAPPASPPLDLAGLEQRLRDTHAIGVFTKLSLKNQVNDLLEQFREFHEGQIQVPLAELRQRYEHLLLEVVTLLQDADSQLANAIVSSREAIWGVLADPKTFAKI